MKWLLDIWKIGKCKRDTVTSHQSRRHGSERWRSRDGIRNEKNTHSSKCLASQGDRLSPESWQGVLYHQTFLYKNLGFKIETVSPLHTLRRALCGGEDYTWSRVVFTKLKFTGFGFRGPRRGDRFCFYFSLSNSAIYIYIFIKNIWYLVSIYVTGALIWNRIFCNYMYIYIGNIIIYTYEKLFIGALFNTFIIKNLLKWFKTRKVPEFLMRELINSIKRHFHVKKMSQATLYIESAWI